MGTNEIELQWKNKQKENNNNIEDNNMLLAERIKHVVFDSRLIFFANS